MTCHILLTNKVLQWLLIRHFFTYKNMTYNIVFVKNIAWLWLSITGTGTGYNRIRKFFSLFIRGLDGFES